MITGDIKKVNLSTSSFKRMIESGTLDHADNVEQFSNDVE